MKGDECLAEKARYSVKVWHTHMYLTGDTTLLYQFPIIQFCWQKQLLARLCLVDKLESKQDKLMSLQIGSLVPSHTTCPTAHTDTHTHTHTHTHTQH